jgi:hypothetical protein
MRAVNLIPAEQRSGASVGAGRSEGGAYAVLGAVAGIAVLTFLYGSAHHDVGNREKQVASLTEQAQRAQTAAQQLAPYTSFVALQQQREQAYTTLVNSRFDWAHAFHELGRVLPVQTSISSITGTIGAGTSTAPAPAPAPAATPAPASSSTTSSSPTSSSAAVAASAASASASTPVASATPAGSVPTFTLSGCATSQPVVAQTLQRLRLMDGVSDVKLSSSSVGGSGGAGGSSTAGCPVTGPTFSVTVTFDGLPASTGSSTTGGAPATPAATTASPTTAQVSAK